MHTGYRRAGWALLGSSSPILATHDGYFARHEAGRHAIVFMYNAFVRFAGAVSAESRRTTVRASIIPALNNAIAS